MTGSRDGITEYTQLLPGGDCPACGEPDIRPHVENRRTLFARSIGNTAELHSCLNCGHKVFLPELEPSLLAVIYADPYFASEAERQAYEAQYAKPSAPYVGFAERIAEVARSLGHGPGARLHEFGCGAGVTVKLLRDMGFNATGSDWSPGAIGFAREQGNEHVYQEDMSTISSMARAGEKLDGVLNLHAIEHVPRPLEMLQEFTKLLGPKSFVYLNTNQGDSIVNRNWGMHFDSWYYFPQHLHYFSGRSFAEIARRAGLTPTHIGTTPRWFDQVDLAIPDRQQMSMSDRLEYVTERMENQEMEMAAVLTKDSAIAPPSTPAPPLAGSLPLWKYDSHADFFNNSPVWERHAADSESLKPQFPMVWSEKGYWYYAQSFIGPHWMGDYTGEAASLLQFVAPENGTYTFGVRVGLRYLEHGTADFVVIYPSGEIRKILLESIAPHTDQFIISLKKSNKIGFSVRPHRYPNNQRIVLEIGADCERRKRLFGL